MPELRERTAWQRPSRAACFLPRSHGKHHSAPKIFGGGNPRLLQRRRPSTVPERPLAAIGHPDSQEMAARSCSPGSARAAASKLWHFLASAAGLGCEATRGLRKLAARQRASSTARPTALPHQRAGCDSDMALVGASQIPSQQVPGKPPAAPWLARCHPNHLAGCDLGIALVG